MARFSLSVGRMARRWLGITAGLALLPGCLVLGDPEVEEPTRTQPQLLAVSPPTGEMTLVRPSETGGFDELSFNAQLRSEDAGQLVYAKLLINYGQSTDKGVQPWQEVASVTYVQPNVGDEMRSISLTWQPPAVNADNVVDCKRVTMVVSHAFYNKSPYENCPAEENDEAWLTWFVGLCGASIPIDECSFDNCAEPLTTQCPSPSELQAMDELNGGGS